MVRAFSSRRLDKKAMSSRCPKDPNSSSGSCKCKGVIGKPGRARVERVKVTKMRVEGPLQRPKYPGVPPSP